MVSLKSEYQYEGKLYHWCWACKWYRMSLCHIAKPQDYTTLQLVLSPFKYQHWNKTWHFVFSSILLVSCRLLTSPCACYCHILDVLAKQLFGLICLCLVKTTLHFCLMYVCWRLVGGGSEQVKPHSTRTNDLFLSLPSCSSAQQLVAAAAQSDQQIAIHWHCCSHPAAHNASWLSVAAVGRVALCGSAKTTARFPCYT